MLIGTAGHIDHGKTTLIRALTGVDTTHLPEEKARGITIELGYAFAPLDEAAGADAARTLAFIDVPGHERFIPTMLMGASGIDFALLVVAAVVALGEPAADRCLSPYFAVKSGAEGAADFPLQATKVTAEIAGPIAEVHVVQTYANRGKTAIEATYIFPASTRAARPARPGA